MRFKHTTFARRLALHVSEIGLKTKQNLRMKMSAFLALESFGYSSSYASAGRFTTGFLSTTSKQKHY